MTDFAQMTDEQLAIAYGAGNDRAFDVLLARNQRKLFSYILFVVKDRDLADDVFQDTFIKVITQLRSGAYTTTGRFSAWLTRIAHNVIIDMYRDRKEENLLDNSDDSKIAQLYSAELFESSREAQFVHERTLQEVVLLMEQLPATQREIVYMRIYQEMPFKEIAETTGVSINTALGRMRYALINMRRMATKLQVAI